MRWYKRQLSLRMLVLLALAGFVGSGVPVQASYCEDVCLPTCELHTQLCEDDGGQPSGLCACSFCCWYAGDGRQGCGYFCCAIPGCSYPAIE